MTNLITMKLEKLKLLTFYFYHKSNEYSVKVKIWNRDFKKNLTLDLNYLQSECKRALLEEIEKDTLIHDFTVEGIKTFATTGEEIYLDVTIN